MKSPQSLTETDNSNDWLTNRDDVMC